MIYHSFRYWFDQNRDVLSELTGNLQGVFRAQFLWPPVRVILFSEMYTFLCGIIINFIICSIVLTNHIKHVIKGTWHGNVVASVATSARDFMSYSGVLQNQRQQALCLVYEGHLGPVGTKQSLRPGQILSCTWVQEKKPYLIRRQD